VDNDSKQLKKIVEQAKGEGLIKFLGKRITIFAANYIYTGTLTDVNDDCVLLSDAAIVYETGAFTDKQWKDAQKLPGPWYVALSAVESYGALK